MDDLLKDMKDSLKGQEQYVQRAERMLDRLEEKVLNQSNQQSSLVSAQSLVNIKQMSSSASVLEMGTPQKRIDHRPVTPFSRQLSQIREQQSEGTMRQGE
jgi:hypothetical protein